MKNFKKILFLTNMFPQSDNDYFGIFIKKNYVALKNNYNVDLSYVSNSKILLVRFIYYFIYFLDTLKKLFNNYDLIYIHYPTRSILPLFFYPLKNTKLILNFHGTDVISKSLINKFLFFLIKLRFINIDLIIVPSNYFKNILKNHFNSKIVVSPSSGVSDNFYESSIEIKNKNKFNLCYISTINNDKGIFDLCSAILLLNSNNYVLNIYGSGSSKNLKLLKHFILKSNGKIIFHGKIKNEKIPKILLKNKFLVFPSKKESLGLVGIESLACGVPIIGSNIPGIQTYLVDNFNGLLFKSGNIEDLSKKIDVLFNDNTLYNRLKINTKNSVLNFKQSLVNKLLLKKINEILK